MSKPLQATSSITFCQVENGISYRIGANPSSVTIPSDETEVTISSLALDFHKKEGDNPEQDYSCNWALFRKGKTGTYTLVDYGVGTSATVRNLKATVTNTDSFIVRIGDGAISSSSSAYNCESVIIVNKDGDTGPGGQNTIRVDLDNDNDSMLYTSGGTLVSGNVVSRATLYDGTTPYTTSGVTWTIVTDSCTATITNNVVTVTAMSANSGSVTVRASYNGKTYSKKLNLKKLVGVDKYDVLVNPSAIAYNATTDTPATTQIVATCRKTSIDGTSGASNPPSGYYIAIYGVKDDDTMTRLGYTNSASSLTVRNADNSTYKEYVAYIGNHASISSVTDFLDREDIPVNKTENGASGQSSFKSTVFTRTNETPIAPDATYGSYAEPSPASETSWVVKKSGGTTISGVYWHDGIPSGDAILWASTRIFSSDGQSPQQSAWSTPRAMTDTADFDVEFSSVANNPGNPTDNPGNWSNTASSSTIWMATRECHNGVWGSWQISKIKGEQGNPGDSPDAYTIVIDSATASVSSNGKLNVNIVAHVVKTTGTSSSVVPSGLTCKIGKQTVSPQARQSDDPYTFIVTDGDWKNTSTYNKATTAVLSFTLNSLVLATAEVAISVAGQMGRNIYFAGDASDLEGTTFRPTDNMAPYVRAQYDVTTSSGTSRVTKLFVYVGESVTGSATKTFPLASTAEGGSTGYGDTSTWEQITSEFKYLITEALFSDFAKLGSAIFNLDFMFSQHGQLVWNNQPVANSSDYTKIDPDDMYGYDTSLLKNVENKTIENTSYDSAECIDLTEASATTGHFRIEFDTTIESSCTLYLYIAAGKDASRALPIKVISQGTNKINSYDFQGNGSHLYLFYRKSDSTKSCVINKLRLASLKFRPNVFVDWLKGAGFLRNLTVEAIINNMIMDIDGDNCSDYGFLTDMVLSGVTYSVFYLNPLKCGSFLRFKLKNTSRLFFPSYCVLEPPYAEVFGYKEENVLFKVDEIRQMVGKKIYIMEGNDYKLNICSGQFPVSGVQSEIRMLMSKEIQYYELSINTPVGSPAYINAETLISSDMEQAFANDSAHVVRRNILDPVVCLSHSQGYKFYVLECKVGNYNGHDCVYWEVDGGSSPARQRPD